ncbi:MAG: hypothetical protein AAB486_01185 [Patescibacteria group bacterium]
MSVNEVIKTQVVDIKKEVALLRSYIIGVVGKDSDGSYRPEFVRRIFRNLSDKPVHIFKSPSLFLKQLTAKR